MEKTRREISWPGSTGTSARWLPALSQHTVPLKLTFPAIRLTGSYKFKSDFRPAESDGETERRNGKGKAKGHNGSREK
jgi:hypothetical protein